jgi:hypothetical protein
MPLVGFEPTISAGERPKTYVLDCAATGTGFFLIANKNKQKTSVTDLQQNMVQILYKFTLGFKSSEQKTVVRDQLGVKKYIPNGHRNIINRKANFLIKREWCILFICLFAFGKNCYF